MYGFVQYGGIQKPISHLQPFPAFLNVKHKQAFFMFTLRVSKLIAIDWMAAKGN
jgi:hypothetical protein